MKFIESKYLELKDKKFNFQKLFLDYWRRELNLDFKNDLMYFENVLNQAKIVHETRLEILDKFGEDNVHPE